MKKSMLVLLLAVTAFVFSSCAGSSSASQTAAAPAPADVLYSNAAGAATSSSSYAAKEETAVAGEVMDYDEAMQEEGIAASTTSTAPSDYQRKIITTFDLSLETTEFEDATARLDALNEEYGGYYESSSVYGRSINAGGSTRSASYTVRIPTEKAKDFIAALGETFNITYQSESAQDITDQYYDLDAMLKAQEERLERLEKMLESADELEYMLQLEQEIASVRYEINSIYSRLQGMDKSVALTTIHLNLSEVYEYQEPATVAVTFTQKMGSAFSDAISGFVRFLQGAVIFLIRFFPFLIIAAVLLFVIIRYNRKKKRAAKEALSKRQEAPGQAIPNLEPPVQPAQEENATEDKEETT